MAMEERLVHWIFASCALVSVVTTVGIVVLLLNQSIGFFQEVSVWEFITGYPLVSHPEAKLLRRPPLGMRDRPRSSYRFSRRSPSGTLHSNLSF